MIFRHGHRVSHTENPKNVDTRTLYFFFFGIKRETPLVKGRNAHNIQGDLEPPPDLHMTSNVQTILLLEVDFRVPKNYCHLNSANKFN